MNKNPDLAEAENNPSSGHYYKKIGNDQYLKGQYKEAIESYTKAIVSFLSKENSQFSSFRKLMTQKLFSSQIEHVVTNK